MMSQEEVKLLRSLGARPIRSVFAEFNATQLAECGVRVEGITIVTRALLLVARSY